MPRKAAGLSAAQVRTVGPGRHGDGLGLYLLVRPRVREKAPARFWLFRYTRAGKMREMGLGPASGRAAVSLADARASARKLHDAVREGHDPLADRDAAVAAAKAEAQRAEIRGKTFREVSRLYLAAHEASWRNAKHRQQWENTLRDYVMPHMGDLPITDIDTAAVMTVLEPIWQTKPETASRVRGRIEALIDYAKARGWRASENPARWRGHVENMLPRRSKVARVQHHAALPWGEIGGFMAELRGVQGVAARALEFTILTGARTGEAIGARWPEFDLQTAIWTVPAERMKAGNEHRVPLSESVLRALQALSQLRDDRTGGWVFPGGRGSKHLSNMGMAMMLRRMDRGDLTVHGFRSTFRDWAAETGQPADIAEAALAHTLGNKVQAAYQRGDLLERRRRLMTDWAIFCAKPRADVVELQSARVAALA